jgi:hypothetical protein
MLAASGGPLTSEERAGAILDAGALIAFRRNKEL